MTRDTRRQINTTLDCPSLDQAHPPAHLEFAPFLFYFMLCTLLMSLSTSRAGRVSAMQTWALGPPKRRDELSETSTRSSQGTGRRQLLDAECQIVRRREQTRNNISGKAEFSGCNPRLDRYTHVYRMTRTRKLAS